MGYILGIDIGIASIGFAGVNHDLKKILFSGVHIFEAAENPKTGASLAEPRRTARGQRRVIHRRAQRKNAIRQLLLRHGLNCLSVVDKKYEPTGKNTPPISPWDLRRTALDRKLTDEELVRILFHIGKHRGFQSNKKSQSNEGDDGKALKGAGDLEQKWIQSGEKTIGAYLSTQSKKRNGNESYDNFIKRDWLREEIKVIFEAQRKFNQIKATEVLRLEYAGTGEKAKRNTPEGDGIAFYQRPLQSSEKLIGDCTFEKGEKRAPKFSYTAELFVLWSRLNNTKIKIQNGDERFLTQDEKNKLVNLAHKNKGGVSYTQARKEIGLNESERFNISYRQLDKGDNSWEKIRNEAEKSNFLKLSGFHALHEALDTGSATDWQKWIGSDRDKLDEVAYITSFIEDGKIIREKYQKLGLNEDQIKKLCEIKNFSKTVDLSLKALRNILPELEKGLRYDEACKALNYNNQPENKGLSKVPKFEDVRNPVVNRALGQTRKVINACIREYGLPDTIVVELAREVGKNFRDRKDIEKEQKTNEARRNTAKTHIAEILGIIEGNVTGEDILKYRLWKEQDCFCPYSGAYITPEMLRDSTSVQIDHIIPYSRSWDNSYMNKVLVLTTENQKKKNDTPFEYLGKTNRWEALEVFARQLPPKKAERLLTENFDDKKAGEWKDRALNDTRYMARLLKSHLEQSLDLGKGNRVQTRNGSLTAHLRGAWGFPDKNRRNDRHHALDAIVIACSTQSMVQGLTNWNKYEARRKNPAERPLPPKPWESFREDAKESVNSIFVSRMPVRKISGAAHEDTIRSIRKSDGKIIQRIKLKDFKKDTLENMVDKARNIKLYDILKERLDAHGGDAKKAFATPVYMPVNDPSKPAPRINSVRILTNEKSGIEINHGLASNGDMVRVDVFKKDNKFWLVPIYVHHFAEDKLPNKAIIAFKDESEWAEMSDNDFMFSLYKNDLIKVTTKKEIIFGYYNGTHRGTGNLNVRTHDSDPSFGKDGIKEGIGIKTSLSFEKFSVDYFGRKHKIEKEKRLGVAHSDDSERGAAIPEQGTGAAAE